jgi:hypothetical protein
MGIDALGRLIKINPDIAEEHQLAVIDCLEVRNIAKFSSCVFMENIGFLVCCFHAYIPVACCKRMKLRLFY